MKIPECKNPDQAEPDTFMRKVIARSGDETFLNLRLSCEDFLTYNKLSDDIPQGDVVFCWACEARAKDKGKR